jgi:hypothetical protein
VTPTPGTAISVDQPELESAGGRVSRGWGTLDASGMRTFWIATICVLGLQLVGLCAYSTYLFHRFDLTDDFATYAQAWWLIGHGHLDPVNTVQIPNYPFWQSHFELAMWPIALVGRVWPHAVQLLWLQDAAMVATEWIAMVWVGALCAARVGRRRSVAASAALAFLVINPWWYLTASFDVHFETLGLPFVLWSAYSLWKGRARTAVIVTLIGLLFGDVTAIALVCVGVAGLISRRVRRSCGWGPPLIVTALSLGWVVLATLLNANQSSGVVTNYGYLVGAAPTATSGWVLSHLVLHPAHAMRVLSGRLGGIGRVIASAGVIGVATPWGLAVSVGILGPAALNVNRAFLTPTIAFQTLTVVPVVVVGSVMVLLHIGGHRPGAVDPIDSAPSARVGSRAGAALDTGGRRRAAAALVLAVGLVALALVQNLPLYGTLRTGWWRVDAPTAATLRSVVPTVPAGAEVIVSQGVIGRFADRRYVYPLVAAPQQFPVHASQVVFVIVPDQGIEPIPPKLSDADITSAAHRLHARIMVAHNGVTVLSWRPPPSTSSFALP